MKAIILFTLCVIFFIGFFLNTPINKVTFYINDLYVHFIVFSMYISIFYILLPKFKFKLLFLFFLFILLAYLVEFIQDFISYRSYNKKDFEFSVLGIFVATICINLFKIIIKGSKC